MRIYTSPLGNFWEGLLIADLIRNLLRKSPAAPPNGTKTNGTNGYFEYSVFMIFVVL